MKKLLRILPHITIVLSLMFGTFLVLNRFNPRMGFISGSLSLKLLAVLCIVSFINSWILVWYNRRG